MPRIRYVSCGREWNGSSRRRSIATLPHRFGYPDSRHLLVCAADRTQNVLWKRRPRRCTAHFTLGDLHRSATHTQAARSMRESPPTSRATARSRSSRRRATSARELYYLPPGSTRSATTDALQRLSLAHRHRRNDRTQLDGSRRFCRRRRRDPAARRAMQRNRLPDRAAHSRRSRTFEQPRLRLGSSGRSRR